MRREILVEEVIAILATTDKIMLKDVHRILNLNHLLVDMILEFLVRFNFAESKGQYIMLSKPCKSFFNENYL